MVSLPYVFFYVINLWDFVLPTSRLNTKPGPSSMCKIPPINSRDASVAPV